MKSCVGFVGLCNGTYLASNSPGWFHREEDEGVAKSTVRTTCRSCPHPTSSSSQHRSTALYHTFRLLRIAPSGPPEH
jgi:hypothetical protein